MPSSEPEIVQSSDEIKEADLQNQTDRTFTASTSSTEGTEGTLPAYLTLLGEFFAMFATFGQVNAFGSFQVWYQDHQLANHTPSDISWIGTLQLWVYFFLGESLKLYRHARRCIDTASIRVGS